MRSEDLVTWDFVQQWLAKARQDLSVAELLLQHSASFDHVGFHAQQAVEKALKTVLVRHQISFPKTHDIARLRGLVAQVDQPLAQRLAPADVLTPFGVEFRYPSESDAIAPEDAQAAVDLAQRTLQDIDQHLAPYLAQGRPDA